MMRLTVLLYVKYSTQRLTPEVYKKHLQNTRQTHLNAVAYNLIFFSYTTAPIVVKIKINILLVILNKKQKISISVTCQPQISSLFSLLTRCIFGVKLNFRAISISSVCKIKMQSFYAATARGRRCLTSTTSSRTTGGSFCSLAKVTT